MADQYSGRHMGQPPSPVSEQYRKYEVFKALHAAKGAFVIPNPWDAGTARILTAMGFSALATTSAGYAFSAGKRDSFASLSRTELLTNAAAIVEATDLPVTADLEDGFGISPGDCARTIAEAIKIGLVGGSIEDATGYPNTPIHDLVLATERIAAAAEACRGQPFLLTARAENFLWQRPDLDDTILRLQAFSKAGADVLYAPGLRDIAAIRTLCDAVDKPVNVLMGISGPNCSVSELAAASVSRISVGGSFARAALGGFYRAASEVLDQGTFTYSEQATEDGSVAAMMAQGRLDRHG
ncbi:isocitrate lyase/phosphoenolpyruvate mutase family protein [Phaeobacter sp. J2-8]|uniref:isocitrate lyase/PEP mutase family protein n=1 Tax=Phaeobacter sp. J2-8 TaxID=2931394 RepID=UPI001FD615D5|nr:isocitrate lyase/phosphoenolpyruvate mutase family protein [Phaeobacter sp. J2-8]MCJ7871395.1 isocitrate lyase/phosphoenolpyruvate mutase family protein [Phaeobacter sp. J2-8]